MEGTRGIKEWKGEYDFDVDGGAESSIPLRSDDGAIPIGSQILGGLIEVDTALDSAGAATAAITTEGAADTQAVAAFNAAPWSSTGRKDIVPDFTGSATLKTTAARVPAVVIADAALIAGKFRVIIMYR